MTVRSARQLCLFVLGIVYMLYCPASGKGYVGQTIRTLDTRWKQHVNSAVACRNQCRLLEAAIRKHGPDAFEKTILQECTTLKELNAAEKYHIERQNTLAPNGYNLHTGGLNHMVSEETRRKLSEAISGRKCKPFSEEHRKKLSESAKNRRRPTKRKTRRDKGGHLSEEHRRKIGEANRKSLLKMNEARRGKPGKPLSPERRRRLYEAHRAWLASRKAAA